jgi:hypothetical protein
MLTSTAVASAVLLLMTTSTCQQVSVTELLYSVM